MSARKGEAEAEGDETKGSRAHVASSDVLQKTKKKTGQLVEGRSMVRAVGEPFPGCCETIPEKKKEGSAIRSTLGSKTSSNAKEVQETY